MFSGLPVIYPVFGIDVCATVNEVFSAFIVSGSHSDMQRGAVQLKKKQRGEEEFMKKSGTMAPT